MAGLTASERMSRMNRTPEARARQRANALRMNADPIVRSKKGLLTEDQTRAVLAEIVAGRDYVDISVDWLICLSRVAKIARANGIHRCRRRLTKEVASAIIARLSAGAGTVALAREFGVHATTISHIKSGRMWASARAA